LKPRNVPFDRSVKLVALVMTFAATTLPASAQQAASYDPDLAQSIRDLREQVQQLRTAVSEIKSEAAQYRAENQELRKELENVRSNSTTVEKPLDNTASPTQAAASGPRTEERVSSLEDITQVLQSELRTLYQTKVESASKYRVRLSGLVLLNLFQDRGQVDNLDVPTYATESGAYSRTPAFGATLRQSELGLEVFGPELAGAKTRGEVQADFGGGFPQGALDGINTGIVRLRTADMRLDWENTSVIAGQDSLFIAPNSPTSFASLLVPSLGYSGNLWAWTPQLRVEHKFSLADDQKISLAGGILDNVTGEASYSSQRLPQAGESSGQPAYAGRVAWTRSTGARALSFGASGYYSRQNWGVGRNVNGWAAITDWRVPLVAKLELSGEFYRGEAVGGLGGGIGQSVVFNSSPANLYSDFVPLNSAGGWSQLKFLATSRLEFNAAYGSDNPFAADVRTFPSPVGIYPTVLLANRSEMMNFIYRPRSELLFSGEYRHLRTSQIGNFYAADHVNLMMGVLF
jgi:regulator of replication initiation timing